jgi:hypothetical protein
VATVDNNAVKWRRKHAYIPLDDVAFGGILLGGATANSTVTATGASGLLVATAGDGIGITWRLPGDVDRKWPIGFRVHWTCLAAAVGARTITWAVTYKLFDDPIAPGATTGVALIASPGTALDTTIALDIPFGTAAAYQQSPRGLMNAANMTKNSCFMQLFVTMSAFNAALVENKYGLGLDIDYVPRTFIGRNTPKDPGIDQNPNERLK